MSGERRAGDDVEGRSNAFMKKRKNCQRRLMTAVLVCGMLVTACGKQTDSDGDGSALKGLVSADSENEKSVRSETDIENDTSVSSDKGSKTDIENDTSVSSDKGSKTDIENDTSVGLDTENKEHIENDTSVSFAGAYTGTTIDASKLFSNRDLSGEYDASKCDSITLSDAGCTTDSKNVSISGSRVTINGEGNYIVTGTLSDGMIIVDVDKSEKVQLVLDGVEITSETSAAIYVKKADKVFVTLAGDTENILKNGGSFEPIDDNHIDAVIFSKDDLTLNGTGTLIIDSPAAHGIVSKNELVITNGMYQITAASHAMAGKDNVAVADGTFVISAGKDAIQSKNEDDDTLGFVYIADGDFMLRAGSDGISAINEIYIAGGTVTVKESYEGLEARIINIAGGEIDITSLDDGLNATDKRAGTSVDTASAQRTDGTVTNMAADKGFGGGMGDTQADANINISGGVIRIDAEGDGVDSNGYITVSGGELYVTGPSTGKDGALDYGIDASVRGGIVVAAGQRNMAQNFGADSTQGTILVNTQQQNQAGSRIALFSSEGRELLAWTMEKDYNSVVVSCPEIKCGSSYIVQTGEVSTEVTMDTLIYGEGFGFGGGMPDFGNGRRPDGMQEPPDFENGRRPDGMQEPPDFENGRRPDGMQEPPDFENRGRPDGMSEPLDFENKRRSDGR